MTAEISTHVGALLSAETEGTACQAGADLLTELCGSPVMVASLSGDDRLRVEASTRALGEGRDSLLRLADQILHETARLDRAVRFDDCTVAKSVAGSVTAPGSYRSGLLAPIGHWGVIIAVSATPGAFTDRDLKDAEVVAGVLEHALSVDEDEGTGHRASDQLETIASVLSHDLVSPLSVARAYVDQEMEHRESEYLEKVVLALDRIDDITSSVETLARTGDAITEREPVELAMAARTGWSTVETDTATLEIESTATLHADEQALCQILENLFSNAVEHGGPDVTVRVGCLAEADGFYVEDDGPGISEEHRERIFDRGFSRADDHTHSGFGLSIVETLVEAHGWQVRLVEADSGGARFEVFGVSRSD